MGQAIPELADLVRSAFSLPPEEVWLNTAHQGALPLAAAREAEVAIAWKLAPAELTTERFTAVPGRLREALSRLLGVPAGEIVLANGASYGLHLLANGLPLGAGDEVLLMAGDFPSNLLPWLGLRERGVAVRVLPPARHVLSADEVEAALGERTRVLCMSWVHSFSGHVADLEAIGRLCRDRGAWFLVNTTQGLGARPLDLSRLPVDAVVHAGWKWLCGPYGTGFCWLRPELCALLRYNQAYWLAAQTADDLGGTGTEVALPQGLGARRYDLFATANFFNFKPWAAAVELLLEWGLEAIASRDQMLVGRLLAGLDEGRYELVSPRRRAERSTLVVIAPRRRGRASAIVEALRRAGVRVALRRGRIRLSPHLYNREEEIDRALEALRSA